MLRTAGASVLVVLILLVSASAILADPPPGNGVSCPTGRCGVGAVDPGAAGSPGAGPSTGKPDSDGETGSSNSDGIGGGAVVVPACTEQPMNPQPAADSIWWRGNSAADGVIVQWVCTGGTTPATCTYCTDLTPHFAATAAAGAGPAAPPPPDPAVLAQQAYQQIPIPKPDIHLGPNPDLVAVNIPVWLWISREQVAPVTVTAGGVSVTATPTLTSVSWSMGEPVHPDAGVGSAPTVTCSGEGMFTAAPKVVAPTVIPACGYTYQWRSLKSRTGGAGTWPISASATWVITWTSNVGQSGTITAPPANSVTNLQVGEWQTVGVYTGSNSGG